MKDELKAVGASARPSTFRLRPSAFIFGGHLFGYNSGI
jgi:hypothetical protein